MQQLNKKIFSYFVCILLIYMGGLILGYLFRDRTILIFLISSIIVSIAFYILARRLAIENSKRWEKTREYLSVEREKLRTTFNFLIVAVRCSLHKEKKLLLTNFSSNFLMLSPMTKLNTQKCSLTCQR